MVDTIEIRRKKLLFRSQRRGTRESDLVLGGFAARWLGRLDAALLDRYEALLEQTDADILAWVGGLRAAPPEIDESLIDLISKYKENIADN
jgi:antitoxin CptB